MTDSYRNNTNTTTRTPYEEPEKLPTILDSNLRTPLRRPNRRRSNNNSEVAYDHNDHRRDDGIGNVRVDSRNERQIDTGNSCGTATTATINSDFQQPLATFPSERKLGLDSDSDDHGNDSNCDYDYSPFVSKKLLCETKIRNFMEAERAEHCLVFHREGHRLDKDIFRADLHVECGEFEMGATEDNVAFDGSIKVADPSGKSKSTRERPAVRLASMRGRKVGVSGKLPFDNSRDSIVQTRMPQLKEFWGDSRLISSLSLELLERENALLLKELEQLDTIKKEMQARISKRPRTSLANRCHRIYKTSWNNASLSF